MCTLGKFSGVVFISVPIMCVAIEGHSCHSFRSLEMNFYGYFCLRTSHVTYSTKTRKIIAVGNSEGKKVFNVHNRPFSLKAN